MNCTDGWTGSGDFSFEKYLDTTDIEPKCLINSLGIRILSYMCIIIPSICNILIVWHYMSLVSRKKTCFSWSYKFLFPLTFLLMGISSVAHGVLKLSYPEPLVGRDLSITLIAFSFPFSATCGIVIYINLILKFLASHSEIMTPGSLLERNLRLFDIFRFYSWFIIPFSFVICILPLIGIYAPNRARAFGVTYLIGLAVICLITAMIIISCLSFLLKELDIHINDVNFLGVEDLKIVVSRLKKARIILSVMIFIQGLTCLLLGASDFLCYLSSYAILLNYTIGPPLALICLLTISRISRRSNKVGLDNEERSSTTNGESIKIQKKLLEISVRETNVLPQSYSAD